MRLSTDGGQTATDEMLVPANGIYEIKDAGVRLVFSSGESRGDCFTRGTKYTVKLEGQNRTAKQAAMAVAVFIGTVLVGIYLFKSYLASKVKADDDYIVHTYEKVNIVPVNKDKKKK